MKIGQLSTKLLLVLAVAFSVTTQFHASDNTAVRSKQTCEHSLSVCILPLVGGMIGYGCAKGRHAMLKRQMDCVQHQLRHAPVPRCNASRLVEYSRLEKEKDLFRKQSEATSPWQGAKIGGFFGTIVTMSTCKSSK